MKTLISILFTVSSFSTSTVHAQPAQETISDSKAVILVCPKDVSDCGGISITVKGKTYSARGNTPSIQAQLKNIAGTMTFHNVTKSPPFAVTGFVSVEVVQSNSGWGPPKGTHYAVFNITSSLGSVPLPKGMPARH